MTGDRRASMVEALVAAVLDDDPRPLEELKRQGWNSTDAEREEAGAIVDAARLNDVMADVATVQLEISRQLIAISAHVPGFDWEGLWDALDPRSRSELLRGFADVGDMPVQLLPMAQRWLEERRTV